jgi:hypothetical protein
VTADHEVSGQGNCGRRLIIILLVGVLLGSLAPGAAFTSRDVDTISSSWVSSFYTVNGTNGYIKDRQTGGIAYFWGQAEMIECVIDAYEWTGNPTYQVMITNLLNGFLTQNGANWSWNIYNDDIMWAVLAFARGGVLTGQTNYINIAKANFDMCHARAWDNVVGGGLYWTTDNNTKNACVNGPGSIAASLLYQIYGDVGYANKAAAIYAWERAVLFNPNNGLIADAIGTNGVLNGGATTYNQGTFIGAANFLGQTNDAALAARFTMMNMTTRGVLPQYGIDDNNSGFNAIYLRWLMRFMRDRNLHSSYEPWLQLNATAAWNGRRADDLSWCDWLQPSSAGVNFFAWDCISSFEIMQAAPPTQGFSPFAVATDVVGHWPMDATSGTNAVDLSGTGNHGRVANATWNAGGRVGGCLLFNGANSLVQITNPLANDFSIAFWVRTTQTGGTPQWYHGRGLVEGDAPGVGNDFGTALVGNKFGFGVGNPDATIVSTSAINDGQWHHCVATREFATGTLKVYVDGNLQATGLGGRNSLTTSPRLLFGAVSSGGGYFSGSLDDVKLFRRTLSDTEVAALSQAQQIAPYAAPPNLSATAAGGQVKLSWAEAPLATGYTVKRSLVSGGPYAAITNLATASFTDTSVLNNRSYYYVVAATNSIGESTNSLPVGVNMSSLVVWFRADALTGLANGTAVSLWPDLTGNGYDAAQNVAGNRPTYAVNSMNGQPAIRFNAANSSYLWFYRPVQDDFTMVFVFKSSQGLNTGTGFWEGAGLVSGEMPAPVNDFGVSLNANGRVLAGSGNPDTSLASASGFNNGAAHVITFKRTRSTGAMVLYVDGGIAAAGTGGTQSLTAPNFLVFGGQGTLNNFLTGDLAEVQIYNSALNDPDRLGLERALKCQYGIPGGAILPAPAGLTGIAGNRRVTLNWILVAGAASYNVWRATNSGGNYELIASNLTTSSYVDAAAVNGQMNYYRVAGANACGAGAQSTLGVLLPVPHLALNASAAALTLSWPGWAADWQLLATTNLNPPVLWWSVTNTVSSSANGFSVTVPIGAGTEFFRLASP